MPEPPEILIRPFTLDDLEDCYATYSDPEVMRYLGDGSVIPSLEVMRERMEARQRAQDEGAPIRNWAACHPETGVLIGAGIYGVIPHSDSHAEDPEEKEIGWHLARAWWGKGYGTAIGRAMLAKASEDQNPVVAVAYKENPASIRIMEKIGMTPAGFTDRFYNLSGLVLYTWAPPSHNQGSSHP